MRVEFMVADLVNSGFDRVLSEVPSDCPIVEGVDVDILTFIRTS